MITNLGFAAYLMMRGYKLLENPSRDIDGKFQFKFDIAEERQSALLRKYANGSFARFDNQLVNLKRMIPRY